ncbi:hypothetical protein [Streptomyces qinglanensis]|uniref:Uncharacterized protein n=1 Tax=Streptomyces qinglanensis TaxID=943816 RepID=A0A1H9U3X5_9ACTN|nr:hypothetical protein [Streptomyces qinglanensis]SES04136.1 hypothetical protein SAMN05421870_107305 [Streptomyces qinglanensis]
MTGQLQIPEPTPGTINAAAGEHAKQTGMTRVDQLDPDWATDCDARIAKFAALGIPFQAADLVADGLDEPPHPNCWGPRFRAAAHAGVIRFHGYAKSKRATVHRSICHEWIGAETEERAA